MQDREIWGDILFSQKTVTEQYNHYANECLTPEVRDAFLGLLYEEHRLESAAFDEMYKRGWSREAPAGEDLLQRVRDEFRQ